MDELLTIEVTDTKPCRNDADGVQDKTCFRGHDASKREGCVKNPQEDGEHDRYPRGTVASGQLET